MFFRPWRRFWKAAGSVHGNDICAGFDRGWVEILEPNTTLIAPGTQEKLEETVQEIIRENIQIFRGDYIGVNPENAADTIDLRAGYTECSTSSCPTFRWVLQDVIEIGSDRESA